MRFTFSDAARARRLAKLLKSALSVRGVDWPLHACREALAEACGYANFHEVEVSAGRSAPSPVDEASDPVTVALRRDRQRAVLLRRGLAPGLADAALAAVPLTGAFGSRAPRAAGPSAPTDRRLRIAASRSAGSAMRAGNYHARTLLDGDGRFLGVSFGTDSTIVHDECPDGFLEAFGVDDRATTVGEGRIPAPAATLVAFSDPGDGCATTLHLNPDLGHYAIREPVRPESFTDADARPPWRYEGAGDTLPGLVTAWSHAGLTLAAFGTDDRDRVRALNLALASGDVSVAHGHDTGPILVLAERLPADMRLDDLVTAVREARYRPGECRARGFAIASLDVDQPSPGPSNP